MTPRTLDVPELSSIEPTETLTDWRRRTHPPKRTTRTVALAYLPTAGLWSAVQAVRYYRRHPRG